MSEAWVGVGTLYSAYLLINCFSIYAPGISCGPRPLQFLPICKYLYTAYSSKALHLLADLWQSHFLRRQLNSFLYGV